MALTDAERKLLEELEQTLTAQDPKLVSKFSQPVKKVHPGQAVGGVLGVLVGLVALVAGLSSFWWISVLGFVIMLVSVVIVMSAWSHQGADKAKPAATTATAQQTSEDFLSRLEKRWRDRQD